MSTSAVEAAADVAADEVAADAAVDEVVHTARMLNMKSPVWLCHFFTLILVCCSYIDFLYLSSSESKFRLWFYFALLFQWKHSAVYEEREDTHVAQEAE